MRLLTIFLVLIVVVQNSTALTPAGSVLRACVGWKAKPRLRFGIDPYVPSVNQIMGRTAHEQWLTDFAPDLEFGGANTERTAAVFWLMTRSAFAGKTVPRWAKEVVATAVSRFNQCPHCQTTHARVLVELGNPQLARALSGPLDEEPDFSRVESDKRELAQIYFDWVKYHFFPRHVPKQMPPAKEIPELSATLSVLQYSNTMTNVFVNRIPAPRRPTMNRVTDPEEGLELLILPQKRRGLLAPDIRWAEPDSWLDQSFGEAATLMRTIKSELSTNIPLSSSTKDTVEAIILATRGNGMLACRRRMADLDDELRRKVSTPELKIAQAITRLGIAPYDAPDCPPMLTVMTEARVAVTKSTAFIEMVSWASYLGMRRIQLSDPNTRR